MPQNQQASLNAPRLNESSPEAERVPSGKINMFQPFCNRRWTFSNIFFAWIPRLINPP